MLTDWGIRDEDVLVHSLGCSAWTAIGTDLGFMAVCECPAPSAYSAGIRSDSVWFSRSTREVEVLVEFERFDGTDTGVRKLEDKARNLLDAAARWPKRPKLCVLSAWSKGTVSAPKTSGLIDLCRMGFKTNAGVEVPPMRDVTLLFNRLIFKSNPDRSLSLLHSLSERLQ